ncbi:MAG TPA: MBL fold metallo-hydrolase [Alphaproteobacteria bacterium]|nr:MBL fold metallo-hydrolase [Alphaproteobacteria bacterium]
MRLRFLGGAGTVTGSKYLLEAAGMKILIDCGLFQGLKQLRLRNWARFPIDPAQIDAVVLTHAHLDHSGYLPLLVKNGFRGPVYCTAGTRDLCAILLPDSGFLQERDAEFANRHGFSRHKPAFPLYTEKDARICLERLITRDFDQRFEVAPEIHVQFRRAGHILGASIVEIMIGKTRLVFSGDLGRSGDPVMHDPTPMRQADYLVVESTYGDRLHEPADPQDALTEVITRTAGRGGVVLIPAFAVGRAQMLMYHLDQLKRTGRIPDLPVYLDSPMAVNASDVFCERFDDHRLTQEQCRRTCDVAYYVRDAEESKNLDRDRMPKVILSASGMATGGRVLHHLKAFAPDARNTILFAGYQAAGTRGAAMVAGAEAVKIHGAYVPVRAEVDNLRMLSAHADRTEILNWLRNFESPPRTTFITHGEPVASDVLRHTIEEQLNWTTHVPEHLERVRLEES